MITWLVAWQRLGKRVFAATDTRATIEELVECGIFYAVHAELTYMSLKTLVAKTINIRGLNLVKLATVQVTKLPL
jgi:hypothetical protein